MLCKLAWGNVRRAGKDYLVYLLTLTLAVTVFYAFNTISVQASIVLQEEGLPELLGSIMSGLTMFLALVMGFLMVYANGFIMKRRKKEFGLYQVLGMSRGQVSRVMALETAIVSGAALVLGIVLGVGFSQLMTFFTASLFKTQIADFHFFFSMKAFGITVGCLLAIFMVTLLFNLGVVRRAKVIDLMSAGRKNEAVKTRNPILSAVIFIMGAGLIGWAYYRLLRDGLPVDAAPSEYDEALQQFMVTTGIVIAGTILFFFGFSGFLLKVLQSARGMYWRGLNMFTMRQLAAKVNTVSFSMAVIAMILFLAITSVTGGMSIANVMNTSVERNTPADYTRILMYYGPDVVNDPEQVAAYEAEGYPPMKLAEKPVDILQASENNVVDPEKADEERFDLARIIGEHVQVDVYDSHPAGAGDPVVTLNQIADAVDMPLPAGTASSNVTLLGLQVMGESDYSRYLDFRGKPRIDLGKDGYLLTSDMGETVNAIYDAALAQGVPIKLAGRTLAPVADRVDDTASSFANASMGSNSGTIIVPDAVIDDLDLPLYSSYLLANYKPGLSYDETEGYVRRDRSWGNVLNADGTQSGLWGMEMTRSQSYESTNSMNGLISYLAIYIGFVLVVACAAILTIQQLSGVADSSKNYRILSELGTSKREITRSVLAQQAVFFIFPLVMGIAHSMVALQVVIEIIKLFGGLSIGFTVGFTCAIFLLCYGGYFLVTYLMSRGIVTDAIRTRQTA
ncbi:FtsX-like permease family protein [Collinsella sp. D33t1_170424_A12]|uniref:FtsX-like permease family protein n=1 Tax=Collinsella sp. D33t1_170424_A12 TaxID=2787135 RepID=UPI00189B2776|nr:ABC transporter permease [Collinsella sp. D33t1_170424_A12]